METKLLQRTDSNKPLSVTEFDNNYLIIEKALFAISELLSTFTEEKEQSYPEREEVNYTNLTPDLEKFLATWGLSKFFGVKDIGEAGKQLVLNRTQMLDELGILDYLKYETSDEGVVTITGLNGNAILKDSKLNKYFKLNDDGSLSLNNIEEIKEQLELVSTDDVSEIVEEYIGKNIFESGLSEGGGEGVISDSKMKIQGMYFVCREDGFANDVKNYYQEDADNIEEVYVQSDVMISLFVGDKYGLPLFVEATLFFTIARDADDPKYFVIKDNKVDVIVNKNSSFGKATFNVEMVYNSDSLEDLYHYLSFTTDVDDEDQDLDCIYLQDSNITSRIVGEKRKES